MAADMFEITLDGTKLLIAPGKTILEVAESQGIRIPTLCHDRRLAPFASCWVCLVKVERAKGFVPSCGTKVAPGMVITTASPDIAAARRMALDLLLSNHYGDCRAPCTLTCPSNIDIQGYLGLVANGKFTEAVELLVEQARDGLVRRVARRDARAAGRDDHLHVRIVQLGDHCGANLIRFVTNDLAACHLVSFCPEQVADGASARGGGLGPCVADRQDVAVCHGRRQRLVLGVSHEAIMAGAVGHGLGPGRVAALAFWPGGRDILNNSSGREFGRWYCPNAPLAQLDRASGYEPGGRRFESCRARHNLLITSNLQASLVPSNVAGLHPEGRRSRLALAERFP